MALSFLKKHGCPVRLSKSAPYRLTLNQKRNAFKATPAPAPDEWSYTEFLNNVRNNHIRSITADPATTHASVEATDGTKHSVYLPKEFQLQPLVEKHIDITIHPPASIQTLTDNLLYGFSIFFYCLLIGVILYTFIGNKFKEAGESETDIPDIHFKDVAGLKGPKQELMEIVDYLKSPATFASLGAELPRGVLLYGPPGTGKTLLAKAVAGEANVPFFFVSGSEFIQVFAGLGASRVRDLFKRARKKSPCIIFIDEIDSIGRSRSTGASFQSGNTEQEQTMNQILTEMDGFKSTAGILVIAATNRKDILDEALIRSGRFDRHIHVPYPAKKERLEILHVHTHSVQLSPLVSLTEIAAATQGMAGADLKNLVNEAKLYAVRHNESILNPAAFHSSLDKLFFGLENTAIELTPEQTELISYHEAGHALLGVLVAEYDLLTRITIVPRGEAGGMTVFQEKEQDITFYSQQYLLNSLIVALGGRVAEQCVYGSLQVTTGAASDLQNVQDTARRMITDFGFNETLGQVSWNPDFPISGGTTEAIDNEIKFLVDWAHREATELIQGNEFYLHRIAEALMKHKTLHREGILATIQGITCELPSKPKIKKIGNKK